MLAKKNKQLQVVEDKNDCLIRSLPSSIASKEVKLKLCHLRKNLMVRQIHTQIKCKLHADWN